MKARYLVTKRFIVPLAATLISLLLLSTGFGATDSKAASAPVTIGVTIPITGAFAQPGAYMQQAISLWQKQVNAKGGLLGRKVKFDILDDQSAPDIGQQDMIKLISQDHVDLVVGSYGASTILREAAVTEQYHMLFIEAVGTVGSLFTNGYHYLVFGGPLLAENYSVPFFQWIAKLPKKERPTTAAFVTNSLSASKALGDTGVLYAQRQGINVLQQDYYDNSATDFNALGAKTASLKPDLVYQSGYVTDTIGYAKAFCAQGYTPQIREFGIGISLDPTFPAAVGASCANGTIATSSYDASVNSPASKGFVATWQKAYGKKSVPVWQHASMYASLQLLQQAVTATKSFNQDTLRNYIGSHQFSTVVNTTRYDNRGVPLHQNGYVVQWQNGKRVTVFPKNVASGKYKPLKQG